jgi:hypothetical protein
MFSDFRKSFNPTQDGIKKQDEWLNNHQLPSKQNIKLLKKYDNLYVSEPIQDFQEDCEHCKNFLRDCPIVEGGDCSLHNCTCGWGFTCDDFEEK